MALASVRSFGGMQPRIDPELLPDGAAQLAVNTRVLSGALEPWRAPSAVLTLSGGGTVRSIYRFGQALNSSTQFWFQFTSDVDVVRGPVPGDTQERTYWTDGAYPKKTDSTVATAAVPYPSTSYRMGVPAPAAAPVATVSGTATDPSSAATTAYYVVTYITAWGEESAPGPVSNEVTFRAGQTVTVTLPGNITGAYLINAVRLYRSNTGSSRTAFQYLTERSVGTANYADTTPSSQLSDALESWDWEPPPDNMIGLCEMAGGILVGFFGNTLCFSEPEVPYAWPSKYRIAFNAPIVGGGSFGQGVFVGTTRECYVVTGVDPSAMTPEVLRDAPSCVSKRSVVAMMGGVVWASPDGLCYVGPGGFRNLTEAILTRDEWQAYAPASITAATLDGRYYAAFDTGTRQATLIFTFGEQASFVESDQHFTAAYTERQQDVMYVVQGGTALKQWDGGAALTAQWKSKEFHFSNNPAMSRGRVEADAYPVTFKLFADGVQRGPDFSVANGYSFPLPAGRAFNYSFQVNTAAKVTNIAIATSAEELARA